jgi:curved DNA-binding protein CbpA
VTDSRDHHDYYELLQISPNAEPETIHRVYRLLATRYHPDNQQTGNSERFRVLLEAYSVLSDPARRAEYDVTYQQQRHERWRPITVDEHAETDFEQEQVTRLIVLEVLYSRRRAEPGSPGVFVLDLEQLTGRPREHLEFTIWYLLQKRLVQRGENSRLDITAEGVDHLEAHPQGAGQRRRIGSGNGGGTTPGV